MDSSKESKIERSETVSGPTEGLPEDPGKQDAVEFKIEIRKLDVPVRPRGVLAE